MDDLDRALVKALVINARASGSALAYRLGVAESTVSHRIKKLQAEGHIRGYHADVDVASLGVTLQALIAIRLVKHIRHEVDEFRDAAPHWPGVLALFHMGGADDFILHVAVSNAEDLRTFVLQHLASHPAVAHAETNIIFEHVTGDGIEHLLS
jgi:DNA-binding Lrp family transcriptional regulator